MAPLSAELDDIINRLEVGGDVQRAYAVAKLRTLAEQLKATPQGTESAALAGSGTGLGAFARGADAGASQGRAFHRLMVLQRDAAWRESAALAYALRLMLNEHDAQTLSAGGELGKTDLWPGIADEARRAFAVAMKGPSS